MRLKSIPLTKEENSMSVRLEEKGLTIRLFSKERSASAYPGTVSTLYYQTGWLAKNSDGRWVDADGVLPPNWQPNIGQSGVVDTTKN